MQWNAKQFLRKINVFYPTISESFDAGHIQNFNGPKVTLEPQVSHSRSRLEQDNFNQTVVLR